MVYNDINESNYIFNYDNLSFYFSSKFYLEKFTHEYSSFLKDEIMKIKIKYKCNIYCDEMLLLLLYKRIEKRGFKVLYNGCEINENYYITSKIDPVSYKG